MADATSPDDRDSFDRLLDAMPRIAEAVNTFSSEKNQRAALDALVRAIGLADAGAAAPPASPPISIHLPAPEVGDDAAEDSADLVTKTSPAQTESPKSNGTSASKRRRSPARKWEPVRDINFRPADKQSFKDLVAEKQPASIDQKNIIAVWWLEQVAELKEIGVGHVLAAYKECDWREPSYPDNALQVTASREHWLDTKNMKSILTTPSGRNVVQFDMPLKKDKKA
ncbi:hypothetical protein ABTZ46_19200 [Nocardioides sp. NPDC126508]